MMEGDLVACVNIVFGLQEGKFSVASYRARDVTTLERNTKVPIHEKKTCAHVHMCDVF